MRSLPMEHLSLLCVFGAEQGQAQPPSGRLRLHRKTSDRRWTTEKQQPRSPGTMPRGAGGCHGGIPRRAAPCVLSCRGRAATARPLRDIAAQAPAGGDHERGPASLQWRDLRALRHQAGKVLVTQEANIPSLVKDTPYAELPERDFYRSLIVHEVVHGVMHQNLKRKPTSHAAYEYPAYALQIASLPSSVRDTFLQSIPNRASPDNLVFNDSILFFDPFFFAVHAYEHFKAADNGCAHLNGLLVGEVAFIPTLPP